MEVKEVYHLPFESEFEWQVSLFSSLKEMAVQAAIQIAIEQKDNPELYEWNDESGIEAFIENENLIERMRKIMENALQKKLE